jgi:hypothetical protein
VEKTGELARVGASIGRKLKSRPKCALARVFLSGAKSAATADREAAFRVHKTLGQLCQHAGLGDDPRTVFAQLRQIQLVEVVLPTRSGVEIRKPCISRPTHHQAILLQRLGLQLLESLETTEL